MDKDTVRSNALPNQGDRTARAEGAVGIGVRSSSLQDESKFINAHRPRPIYRPRCFLWMSRGVFALRPSLESYWILQSSLYCGMFTIRWSFRGTARSVNVWCRVILDLAAVWRCQTVFSGCQGTDVFALRPSLDSHVVCSYRSLLRHRVITILVRGRAGSIFLASYHIL